MDPHERLEIDGDAFDAVADHFTEREYEGRPYRFLPDYRRQLERGTVLIGDTAVRGFPKIPRTLVLDGGITRHFEGDVVIEEKLNGYNTRIARIDGRVYGFLRSGRICPFTTWFVRNRLDLDGLFDAASGVVLCGELIGPANPYTPHTYPGIDTLAFRAFDLRNRETGTPWPVARRRDRLDELDIPQVVHLGTVPADEAAETVRGIVERLDREGREGIVMKTPDGQEQLKYTTSAANQGDLAFAFSLPFDYGRDFMFRRLIREAFQSVELDTDTERTERIEAIGEAILRPMIDAIEAVDGGERIGEDHAVRAPPTVVERLFEHLEAMGLRLEIIDDELVEGERHVRFRKLVQSSNDKIEHYLDGAIVRE